MRYYTLLILLGCTILFACRKVSNDGIPSYIQINEVALVTGVGEGSALHGISDVWIESEELNVGAYEYPATIPVLRKGNRNVLISAGIKLSANFFIREVYPFYTFYSIDTTFVQKDTVEIKPIFRYREDVEFALIEDFESSNVFSGLDKTDVADPENIEGKCGYIELDDNNTNVLVKTSNQISLLPGSRTFLEIHYKGSNDFGIGLEPFQSGQSLGEQPIALLSASDEWRKVYYDLSTDIGLIGATEYRLFIEAFKISDDPNTNVFIDNVKIIYL